MQTIDALKDKITSLESERSRLTTELENLRKIAENKAASLETDVALMNEEVNTLKQLLGSNSATEVPPHVTQPFVPKPQAPPVAATQFDPEPQPELDIDTETTEPIEPEPEGPTLDSVMATLREDERKVVEVLLAHEGKYPQKNIRTEANLSWLQTNRIITHLNENGIVSVEKGVIGNVTLSKELMK
jgi:uncharacterized membrane protein